MLVTRVLVFLLILTGILVLEISSNKDRFKLDCGPAIVVGPVTPAHLKAAIISCTFMNKCLKKVTLTEKTCGESK